MKRHTFGRFRYRVPFWTSYPVDLFLQEIGDWGHPIQNEQVKVECLVYIVHYCTLISLTFHVLAKEQDYFWDFQLNWH